MFPSFCPWALQVGCPDAEHWHLVLGSHDGSVVLTWPLTETPGVFLSSRRVFDVRMDLDSKGHLFSLFDDKAMVIPLKWMCPSEQSREWDIGDEGVGGGARLRLVAIGSEETFLACAARVGFRQNTEHQLRI